MVSVNEFCMFRVRASCYELNLGALGPGESSSTSFVMLSIRGSWLNFCCMHDVALFLGHATNVHKHVMTLAFLHPHT